MPTKGTTTANLGLRGKSIDDLRALATQFLDIPATELLAKDKLSLIADLTQAASENKELAREIKKIEVAVKPSFYLMVFVPNVAEILEASGAKRKIQRLLDEENRKFENNPGEISYKDFQVQKIVLHEQSVVEAHFTWQRIYWYWSPEDFSLSHIYELQFGFAALDFSTRKGLIACHTSQERSVLSKALCKTYSASLTPLVLTKEILNQIGSFDHVKRAGYLRPSRNSTVPTNVTYADENLAAIPIVRQEEESPQSQRKHSFYRIPLDSIVEHGVGATSDSGKLWVPKELPLESIRKYGTALLGKISRTLNSMTQNREYEQVLDALGISSLPRIVEIENVALRGIVVELVREVVNMLLTGQKERPYTISPILATEGIPSLFQYARLQLTDTETGDVAYWSDSNKTSQLIRITKSGDTVKLKGHPSGEEIDVSYISHPLTDTIVQMDEPLARIDLIPTARFTETLLDAVKFIANQIEELRSVISIPLRLSSNILYLDTERAFGRTSSANIETVVLPTDISDWHQPMSQTVPRIQREEVTKKIRKLGEKCKDMNDDNCRSCVSDMNYICLRSLVARYLKSPLILAHKGIELSDIQGNVSLGDQVLTMFGFAKLAESNGGLTARNKNGAILLAQVIGQIDKAAFNTVLIISPSTIN